MTEISSTNEATIASPERLRVLSAEELSLLPEIPFAVTSDDGRLLATEKQRPLNALVPRSKRHLYEPSPISAHREAQLNEIAQQLGYADLQTMATTPMPRETLEGKVPAYLIRRLTESSSALDAVREMRRASLEQKYTTRAIALGLERLQKNAPALQPVQPTVGLVEEDEPASASYLGNFGGTHLMSFRGRDIGPHHIDSLTIDSEAVHVAVHELIHQKHAEILNFHTLTVGATTANKEQPITDPWEVKLHADEYWKELMQHPTKSPLCHQASSHLVETVAYLGESIAWGTLEDTSTSIERLHPEYEGFQESEHTWVTTFAAEEERLKLVERLMQIDFRILDSWTDEQLRGLINNPLQVLSLTRQ